MDDFEVMPAGTANLLNALGDSVRITAGEYAGQQGRVFHLGEHGMVTVLLRQPDRHRLVSIAKENLEAA